MKKKKRAMFWDAVKGHSEASRTRWLPQTRQGVDVNVCAQGFKAPENKMGKIKNKLEMH